MPIISCIINDGKSLGGKGEGGIFLKYVGRTEGRGGWLGIFQIFTSLKYLMEGSGVG